MMEKSVLNPNQIWIFVVLVHIAGSVMVSLMGVIPLGTAVLSGVICFFAGNIIERKPKNYLLCILCWILSLLIMNALDREMQASFLLNELLFVCAVWIGKRGYVKTEAYCGLKKISVKMLVPIICIAVLLFIMAGYVNACSMIVFQNYVTSSIETIKNVPLAGLAVAAIAPAVVEELYFRGFIYRGMNNKLQAVLLSSLLFALLHMNFNQMCYAFVMGLFFAAVVCVTDNLTISILLHMIFNSFTVFSICFENSPIVQKIMAFQLNGYRIFQSVVMDSQGNIHPEWLFTGGIIALFSLAGAAGLLILLSKMQKKMMERSIGELTKETKMVSFVWKPDLKFYVGCAICLLVAVLYEFFL
ncbi:MAG: CPBP family intramembrane metalloprotease [Eubacterium sp.]|nr:CPBP family intramembrane metalloprotease [Eubacterium sp.]MDD7210297.1 CPBP family intramembrane metalloprotease [Lachnospiraceae bacterium]MDY5496851.1 CPBP family intramembrane glutamic endopeptidase [Anaerobutyricum sp.]